MKTKRGKKLLKRIALFEIFLMISVTFAFAVVMSGSVNAQTESGKVVPTQTGGSQAAANAASQAAAAAAAANKNKAEGSSTMGSLGAGIGAAATVYGLVQGIGSALGWQKSQTNAWSIALASGIAAGSLAQAAFKSSSKDGKTGNMGASIAIGVVVTLIVLWLLYKKTETRIVEFECLPYEPPLGGSQCEECNKDNFRPCSEYRCKALGQACQLLNPGTGKELCAWITKNDVKSPIISAWNETLKPNGLKYVPNGAIRPPMRGVKIINQSKSSGCLTAFSPLEFGVILNEPAQCKLDFDHKTTYDGMGYLFGDNYYLYNHTIKLRMPGNTNASLAGSPELPTGSTASLYTRCRDANGNYNVDEFVFTFCVDNSTDLTPPYIDHTSIKSGSPVRYNVDSVPMEVYLNEPSNCRWSRIDRDYSEMENNMSCLTAPESINNNYLYTCKANLTGVKDGEENRYFFRCKDLPDSLEKDRNVMKQSYPFSLRGTEPLIIIGAGPNETIKGSTTVSNVTLIIETAHGSDDGKAVCLFSTSTVNGTYIPMFETDSYVSIQDLYLSPGVYTYYFSCNDNGGNAAQTNVTFTVFHDNQAPIITRVYKEEPGSLKIITNEEAECAYSIASCNFEISNSTTKFVETNPVVLTAHYTSWKSNSAFYIRCKDPRGNEPYPGQCSLIVKTQEDSVQRVLY